VCVDKLILRTCAQITAFSGPPSRHWLREPPQARKRKGIFNGGEAKNNGNLIAPTGNFFALAGGLV
jgi:hypothetical protein